MWKKLYKKLLGGVKINILWKKVHKKILAMGSTANLNDNFKRSMGDEGDCCSYLIILPDNVFHKYWDPVMVLLLMYTAFFVPYKIAFMAVDPIAI